MADACAATETPPVLRLNVADRLREIVAQMPDAVAIACPQIWSPAYRATRRGKSGTVYATTTFAELDADTTQLARGLATWGVPTGTRLALLVRPGIEFVTLVFALLRAGMVTILVDPGLGRRNLMRCLAESEPEGFVAISLAQAVRTCLRRKFPRARWNVTVGRRWFWGGMTLERLRQLGATGSASAVAWAPPTDISAASAMMGGAHPTTSDDPAAIIFTSGSTGPPKGVLYTQRMFDTQVSEIQSMYHVEPGGVDLACFPLFALFNSAMGVTTVLPEMDFSRPATADPKKLLVAANDWQVTQAFASPAVWRVVGAHCAETGGRIESLRQVFSCGAPVAAGLLQMTLDCVAKDAKMHTPYGATECLPAATIEASEVFTETAQKTDEGAGVCVGRKLESIDWRVIRITDEPIDTIDDAEELPTGEIGELIVRGPQASPCYVTHKHANAAAKIAAGDGLWHRMGDVGYFDEHGRFWYCGRKSQRVRTRNGPLFTEKVEAVFNSLPGVRRSAFVGVGPAEMQSPVVVIEPEDRRIANPRANNLSRRQELIRSWYDVAPHLEQLWYAEQGFVPLAGILFHPNLPVDVRHNAKINREQLAKWAAMKLKTNESTRSVEALRSHTERGNEI
jgi:olefin beta-lactone synthetase